MRKLRVGFWVADNYTPEVGGGYGYYSQLLNALRTYEFADAEITFISFNLEEKYFKGSKFYKIRQQNAISKISIWVLKKIRIKPFSFFFAKKVKERQEMLKKELNEIIDIIYYPIHTAEIDFFPFICTLWDLGHKNTYSFPETCMNGEFESRKKYFDLIPHKALMIFCESEAGKNETVKYLDVNENRIKVVPIFSSGITLSSVASIKPPGLQKEDVFIHYPAQYWAHKNHYNLLMSFKKVLIHFPTIKLILTGSDKGNKAYVLDLINELGINNCVVDLGFISVEELKWIYLNSAGLVMPTFLGPTNMPLLEAAELGCPVCCSNLEGHQEQLGEYAYYFNPLNQEEISDTIIQMVTDKLNGRFRTYKPKFTIVNSLKCINDAFHELKNIRFCWGAFDEIY